MLGLIYLLRRLPRSFKVLLAAMLIGTLVESLVHTFSVIRTVQERQQHVHTRRSSR